MGQKWTKYIVSSSFIRQFFPDGNNQRMFVHDSTINREQNRDNVGNNAQYFTEVCVRQTV